MLNTVPPNSNDGAVTEFVNFEREVLHDNISLCDEKSGILLAFSAAMVVYCLQALSAMTESHINPLWKICIHILYLLGTAGFFAATYFSLRVIKPRLLRYDNDHVFWESELFRLPEQEYLSSISSLDADTLNVAMQKHLHRLAGICRRKYANMRYAIWCGEIAFVAVVAAELIQVFK